MVCRTLCSSGSTAPINGIVGALRQSRRVQHGRRLCCLSFTVFRNSSGSLAIFTAIRRASSPVSNFAAALGS